MSHAYIIVNSPGCNYCAASCDTDLKSGSEVHFGYARCENINGGYSLVNAQTGVISRAKKWSGAKSGECGSNDGMRRDDCFYIETLSTKKKISCAKQTHI